jgi:heme/copper-type cytochrome/quinol oxidase subunit 1
MLSESLGKVHFWLFFLGFHLTFFPQHFLGLMGLPRRYFTYMPGYGLETGNFLSSIGAFLQGVALIVFLINIIVTSRKPKDAGNDPWDGFTLEWTIPSPAPEYNFKQTPIVRGLDAFWKEKMAGNKEMTPAEPIGPIHMPSPTILPLVMTIGLFIAGYGFMYHQYLVAAGGLLVTIICMFLRSLFDDHGWHVEPEELEDKGLMAQN